MTTEAGRRLLANLGGTNDADYQSPTANAIAAIEAEARAAALAEVRALREAAQPILDRCLDFFGEDDLDPESSEAMPVVIKNRWVYALRAALLDAPAPSEPPHESVRDASARLGIPIREGDDIRMMANGVRPGPFADDGPTPSEPGLDALADIESLRWSVTTDQWQRGWNEAIGAVLARLRGEQL